MSHRVTPPPALSDLEARLQRSLEASSGKRRAAERWRSIKITEFERRQMASVRKELDQEYEAMVGLNVKPSKDESQVRKSGSSRT